MSAPFNGDPARVLNPVAAAVAAAAPSVAALSSTEPFSSAVPASAAASDGPAPSSSFSNSPVVRLHHSSVVHQYFVPRDFPAFDPRWRPRGIPLSVGVENALVAKRVGQPGGVSPFFKLDEAPRARAASRLDPKTSRHRCALEHLNLGLRRRRRGFAPPPRRRAAGSIEAARARLSAAGPRRRPTRARGCSAASALAASSSAAVPPPRASAARIAPPAAASFAAAALAVGTHLLNLGARRRARAVRGLNARRRARRRGGALEIRLRRRRRRGEPSPRASCSPPRARGGLQRDWITTAAFHLRTTSAFCDISRSSGSASRAFASSTSGRARVSAPGSRVVDIRGALPTRLFHSPRPGSLAARRRVPSAASSSLAYPTRTRGRRFGAREGRGGTSSVALSSREPIGAAGGSVSVVGGAGTFVAASRTPTRPAAAAEARWRSRGTRAAEAAEAVSPRTYVSPWTYASPGTPVAAPAKRPIR